LHRTTPRASSATRRLHSRMECQPRASPAHLHGGLPRSDLLHDDRDEREHREQQEAADKLGRYESLQRIDAAKRLTQVNEHKRAWNDSNGGCDDKRGERNRGEGGREIDEEERKQ